MLGWRRKIGWRKGGDRVAVPDWVVAQDRMAPLDRVWARQCVRLGRVREAW